jgi:hypothetical protein
MIELLTKGEPDGRHESDHETLCAVVQGQRLALKALTLATLHNNLLSVIDCCSLWMTMTQHLADLAERSPMAQHLGGETVAELMGTHRGCVYASALKRMPDEGDDAI